MSVCVVTGSAGLIGSEAARVFHDRGYDVVGVDNDMRREFFGDEASTRPTRNNLVRDLKNYTHLDVDIRDNEAVDDLFRRYGSGITAVIHTAAQPSHDWAARAPLTDFSVNALGTVHLLEATRQHCQQAAFIFTSTNKVYGDRPNGLPLIELGTRWSLPDDHPYARHGIDEAMSIDSCLHSVFGASKVAADVMAQEYGRYFGLNVGVFRGGCLTGPGHAGAELHGFLAYLVKCVVGGRPYRVFGYKGKQVRDNIHSADLVEAFWHFAQSPRQGEVYNIGGGPSVNCSMLEAIDMSEEIVGRKLQWTYEEDNRKGDHMWWISDTRRFESHYPNWRLKHDLRGIITEIRDELTAREDQHARPAVA